MTAPRLYIGIDPGKSTGYAECANGKITVCTALPIHEALAKVYSLSQRVSVFVIFEDARKIGGINGAARGSKAANARAQGAGSVKRDSTIWADFLEAHQIPHRAVSPLSKGRKQNAITFKRLAQWEAVTNQHGRDAAMLIVGLK